MTMTEQDFAAALGFESYEDLIQASESRHKQGDIDWYITELPDGRWAAWDDAELALDRVYYAKTRGEAVTYLESVWDEAQLLGRADEFVERLEQQGHTAAAHEGEIMLYFADHDEAAQFADTCVRRGDAFCYRWEDETIWLQMLGAREPGHVFVFTVDVVASWFEEE